MTDNEELKKAALQLKAMVICTNIKRHLSCSGCVNEKDCGKDEYNTDEVFAKSANIIFDALEELESYRAIGTVEEIENSFKKTINAFEKANPLIKSALDILQEYQSIGTIDEFKALKEKNTPKKGIPYTSSNNHKFVECPSCHKDMDLYYDFCQYCGQAVDWGKSKT